MYENKENQISNEALAEAIKAGDESLLGQLWLQVYGFIKKKAIKWVNAYQRPDIELDDLTQSGYFAMCDAVQGFEPGRGSFLKYLDFKLYTEFRKTFGVLTSKQNPLNNAISLEEHIGNAEDSLTIIDTIESEEDCISDKDEDIYKEQLSNCVRCAVARLPDRQRKAIEAYFFHGMKYSEMALELCVSNARAGQLVHESLKALRTGKDSRILYNMLYDEISNPYKGTGFHAWKNGGSKEERDVERKEGLAKGYGDLDTMKSKLSYCVNELGLSYKQAKAILKDC